MIKKFSLLSFLCGISILFGYHLTTKHQYIFRIARPPELDTLKGVSCYYKGTPYDLAEGWCLIRQDKELVLVSILIAENIEWSCDGNMIRHLKLIQNKPFLWFDLTLILTKHGVYSWKVEQRAAHEVPARLPESTLFIQLNPELVEGFQKEEPTSHSSIIEFPTLLLKKSLTREQFDTMTVYTQLALPDLKTIHREPRKAIKTTDPLKVAMITVK